MLALFPSFVSAQVVISEIVSNPTDGGEWVELWNQGEASVDLEGWTFTDNIGVFQTLQETVIQPHQFVVFEGWHNKLNNTGDILQMHDANGVLIAETSFGSLEKGESWALIDDVFTITTTITKGLDNADNRGNKQHQ